MDGRPLRLSTRTTRHIGEAKATTASLTRSSTSKKVAA
jgi:hypothetical protein